MRLVTWNCKGAFHRKHPAIVTFRPDILVVPEAEELVGVTNILGTDRIRSVEWVGGPGQKGLGVLSYGDYQLRVHRSFDRHLEYVLPLEVSGPVPLVLFAVWTVKHKETGFYVQCLFEALEVYSELLASPRVVWAGDFNNSVLFDRPSSRLSFATFIEQLSCFGLESLYHLQKGCPHGQEPDKTFFLYHHADKGYHIDYIFASRALRASGFEISVGAHSDWATKSDHMPLVCSFGEVQRNDG